MSNNYPPVSGINDDLGVVFVNGYTGPCRLDPPGRAQAKSAFRVRDAEAALSLLAAEIMGLKIDADFFPGVLPVNTQKTLFSLEFVPADTGRGFSFWQGRAVLRGRSPFRRELTEKWGAFLSALPLPDWVTVNSNLQQDAVTFCRIEPLSGDPGEVINCRGLEGYAVETDLKVVICISPPEPVSG